MERPLTETDIKDQMGRIRAKRGGKSDSQTVWTQKPKKQKKWIKESKRHEGEQIKNKGTSRVCLQDIEALALAIETKEGHVETWGGDRKTAPLLRRKAGMDVSLISLSTQWSPL